MSKEPPDAQPVRREPCHAMPCYAVQAQKSGQNRYKAIWRRSRVSTTALHLYSTKSDLVKDPMLDATQAETVQDEDLRCFSLCCPLLLLVPSLNRRSRSSKSASWLFDRRGDAVEMAWSFSVAPEPPGPSGFNGTISTLPLPLPFAGGCSLKSNIPVAWKDAAAAAAEAFGTGRVRLAVRFS